ncbi:hypothetical protein OPV22_031150 [Ensete ventricosum]|uniref:Uncharacterized protein n=1 Tax=Ensete ventricosum TaxID=4639 RepID=A0AAV8PNE9_ENSVE|nr:hypothetical protein OPV22_031150 [Ensete ventricosum]
MRRRLTCKPSRASIRCSNTICNANFNSATGPVPCDRNQALPSQPSSANSSEVGEADAPPGSSKSNISLVGKARISNQATGRDSFLYGGAQVIGATGAQVTRLALQHIYQLLRFEGQHPASVGVSAMRIAVPGHVAQPQLGFATLKSLGDAMFQAVVEARFVASSLTRTCEARTEEGNTSLINCTEQLEAIRRTLVARSAAEWAQTCCRLRGLGLGLTLLLG